MSDIVQVFTTIDSKEGADGLALLLVERRLAACVQVLGPVSSTYWWEGAVETADEWLCLIKTGAHVYGELERAIRENHPYEVPEVLAVPVTGGHSAYIDWLREQLNA
jgi:periplasmic divalent cation tolerance protein